MSIELPPPPATVTEALARANFLAYGFEKHKDPAYWLKGVGYVGDPVYYWKRMLGWQAGPEDRAQYGLFAEPPRPWNGSAVSPPPVVVPPDPPVIVPPIQVPKTPTFTELIARLDAIDARLTDLLTRTKVQEGYVIQMGAAMQKGFTGRIFGATFTLKPTP